MLFPLYFIQLSCAVQKTDICFFLQTGMHKLTENTEELQIINEQRVSLAFELKGYWYLNKVFFMAWTPTLTVIFISHSLKGMDVPKHPKTCAGILHTRRHDTQRFCLSPYRFYFFPLLCESLFLLKLALPWQKQMVSVNTHLENDRKGDLAKQILVYCPFSFLFF